MNNILKILIHPKKTLQKIIELEQKPIGTAFVIFVLSGFIKAFLHLTNQPFISFGSNHVLKSMLYVPTSIISGLIGWTLIALALHVTAKFFKGRGEIIDTIALVAYAQIPFFLLILILPLANINLLNPPQLIGGLISLTVIGSQLIVSIWRIVLIIIGLEIIYKLDYKKAVETFLLPGCGCAILIIGSIIILGGFSVLGLAVFLNK
jgi:hypothetical protein